MNQVSATVLSPPPRMFVEASDLEERIDNGADRFAKWICRVMDNNEWSHPQIVQLCKICTGNKALLHSSQVAGLRKGHLKSPGPKAFLALEYLFRTIDKCQKGEGSAIFGTLRHLIDDAEIMRDPDGNPATLGYLVEVFTGVRDVPIDLTKNFFNESQAETISNNAGKLVRRMMAIGELDPISDAGRVAAKFPGNSEERFKFAALIKGAESWKSEEIESSLNKLSRLLKTEFEYKRTTAELLEQLK